MHSFATQHATCQNLHILKFAVFWDIMPSSLTHGYWQFRGALYLHLWSMVYVIWYYYEIYIRMSCFFHSKDKGRGFLWNIGICVPNYTVSYPRHNNSFHRIRMSVLLWNNHISVLPQWYLIWIATWMYTVPFSRKCHRSFKSSLHSLVLCNKYFRTHGCWRC